MSDSQPTSHGSTQLRSRPLETKEKWIQVLDKSEKPIEAIRLPLTPDQSFQWTLPNEWLAQENPQFIEIRWIDFFRN